jgi:hypothetical protein
MYILTIDGKKDEGAFAVEDDYGSQVLYFFEEEDDAERYLGLLEAEDYPKMQVVKIKDDVAIKTCELYNYQYVIINSDDLVIPPKEYDIHSEDKI